MKIRNGYDDGIFASIGVRIVQVFKAAIQNGMKKEKKATFQASFRCIYYHDSLEERLIEDMVHSLTERNKSNNKM